ncbi:O-acetyl-ADP-ribose deacetylase (regulator of RNase III) [Streptomyces nodosus]|nr:O-acetyl-ADP-ribose deacetylase (regulator of RNase III) [Streptomyces nodosus]
MTRNVTRYMTRNMARNRAAETSTGGGGGVDWEAAAAAFDDEPDHGLRDRGSACGLGRPAGAMAAAGAR